MRTLKHAAEAEQLCGATCCVRYTAALLCRTALRHCCTTTCNGDSVLCVGRQAKTRVQATAQLHPHVNSLHVIYILLCSC